MTLKFERETIISAALLLMVPVLALLHAIATLRSTQKNTTAYLLIALCYFFFFLKIPPLADLYRHYQDYDAVNFTYAIGDALRGKIDVMLYANSYLFKIIGIPFFLIPASYTALAVFLYLKAFNGVLRASGKAFSPRQYVLLHVVLLFLLNPFVIAMGLRFGLAMALMTYAVVSASCHQKYRRAFLLMTCAVLTHFSSMLLVAVWVCHYLLVLNRLTLVLFSAGAVMAAKSALPLLLSYITFAGINSYSNVYTSGLYASEYLSSGNVNGMINFMIILFPALVLAGYLLAYPMHTRRGDIQNYAAWLIVFIFLSSSSLQAASRYASVASLFLLFNYVLCRASFVRGRYNYFFLLLVMIATGYHVIENIYVPRRPILLGNMWTAFYQTPLLTILYSETEYGRYFDQINPSNGEWIGHEMEGS